MSNKEFKTKIPGKIVLFGEWAVLQGYPALSAAQKTYFELKAEPNDKFLFQSQGEERKISDFPYLEKLWQGLGFDQFDWNARALSLKREWPLEIGFGSSSALTLALLKLRYHLKGENLPQAKALWAEGLKAIHGAQNGRGSGLDLATQIAQQVIFFQSGDWQNFPIEFPEDTLRLIHTGTKMNTSAEIKKIESFDKSLLKAIGSATEAFLVKKNWAEAIEQHYLSLLKLGVVPNFIQEAQQDWKSRGWIETLKTTGAGGGDTLLALIVPRFEAELRRDLKNRSWWISSYGWMK